MSSAQCVIYLLLYVIIIIIHNVQCHFARSARPVFAALESRLFLCVWSKGHPCISLFGANLSRIAIEVSYRQTAMGGSRP